MWADIFPWKHPRDTAPWYVAENTPGNVRPLRAQSGRLAGDAAPRTRASTPLPLHSPSLQWGWHGGTLGTQRPWLGGADRLPAYPRCGGASQPAGAHRGVRWALRDKGFGGSCREHLQEGSTILHRTLVGKQQGN